MSKIIPFLFLAALLNGCALFAEQSQKSAETLGRGISSYCANMPASERPAFRAQVEEACNCKIDLACPE